MAKVAIVTGGSSGIGRAIIKSLRDIDWKVIAPSRADINLANLDDVTKASEKLAGELDKVDALIHVAGVWHDESAVHANKDLEDFTPQQIADTIAVGLTSFMIIAAKFLPKLAKDGAVIGITGTFADGSSGWLPYYTSKRAQEDFLVGLAQDYPSGPRVFGISPADTATDAYKKFYPQYADQAQSPEAIASLCLQLVTGQGHHQNGDIIEIRNGMMTKGYHV